MISLTPLICERFACELALAVLRGPTERLWRLVKQIDDASQARFNPLVEPEMGIIGQIGYTNPAGRIYNSLKGRVAARYGMFIHTYQATPIQVLTPSQAALSKARDALWQNGQRYDGQRYDDHDVINSAADLLRQHYPLEALAMIL